VGVRAPQVCGSTPCGEPRMFIIYYTKI